MAMVTLDELTKFCKEKGIVFPSAEIYGSFSGFWDFGPMGVEIKNNIKYRLWKDFVSSRQDVVGIDGAIVTNPKVWKASGHVDSFEDDNFNLMFETKVGAGESAATSYLRPETAQMIFTNFRLVMDSSRMKLPFGIAQVGKAFRNEISPREFLFRSREFEQFEIEFFCDPEKVDDCPFFEDIAKLKVNILLAQDIASNVHITATVSELVTKKVFGSKWHAYWVGSFYKWFLDYGINPNKLRIAEHPKSDLAHYAKATFDLEYEFPFGWREIHGNADRGDYDLSQHKKHSGKDLSVFDDETKKRILPAVVSEPSQGIERGMLAFLFDAYLDDEQRGNIVLKLDKRFVPIQVGIFPLVNKLNDQAKQIFDSLRKDFKVVFDKSGSIGRRYARADELGIPFCITFDFESVSDNCVTVRNRDDTKQERISIGSLKNYLNNQFNSY